MVLRREVYLRVVLRREVYPRWCIYQGGVYPGWCISQGGYTSGCTMVGIPRVYLGCIMVGIPRVYLGWYIPQGVPKVVYTPLRRVLPLLLRWLPLCAECCLSLRWVIPSAQSAASLPMVGYSLCADMLFYSRVYRVCDNEAHTASLLPCTGCDHEAHTCLPGMVKKEQD